MASCASCGKQSDALKTCTACKSVKYCGRECQTAHRKHHRKACKNRARELAEEAELISVLRDATMKPVGEDSPYLPVVDLPSEGACCWICLGEGDDEQGMPLMRECACRGDAGFSHPLCLAKYCRQRCDRIDTSSHPQASIDNWVNCHNCKMNQRGLLGLCLAEAHLLWAVKNKMPNSLEVYCAKKDIGIRLLDRSNTIRDPKKNECALARKDLRRALHFFEEQVKTLEGRMQGDFFDQQTTMCFIGDALKICALAHERLGEVDNELSYYRRAHEVNTEYIKLFGMDGTAAQLTMSINAEIERITGEKAPPLDEGFIDALKRDIQIMTREVGEDYVTVYIMQYQLFDMLKSRNDYEEALGVITNLVSRAQRSLGRDHSTTKAYEAALSDLQRNMSIKESK